MPQIPLSFHVPWNFSAEELKSAHGWAIRQAQLYPDRPDIQAAKHILGDLWAEYCKQTGQDAELPNQPEVKMVRISTYTGVEHHTSNGAKGYVWVIDPFSKEEVHIHEDSRREGSSIILHDQEKYNSTHYHWTKQFYDVPDGTILKLMSVSTHRRVIDGGGYAYLKVDSSLTQVHAEGMGYQGDAAYIKGPLRLYTMEEAISELGVKIPAQYKTHYKTGKITIEPVEE